MSLKTSWVFLIILIGIVLFAAPARATAPNAPRTPKLAIELPQVAREYTKGEMIQIATQKATERNLNVDMFLAVIACESGWNRKAVGDGGTSHGLAQLHKPIRDWGVTPEQAYDPEIALEIMAKAWARGEQNRWTCFRLLKRQEAVLRASVD